MTKSEIVDTVLAEDGELDWKNIDPLLEFRLATISVFFSSSMTSDCRNAHVRNIKLFIAKTTICPEA